MTTMILHSLRHLLKIPIEEVSPQSNLFPPPSHENRPQELVPEFIRTCRGIPRKREYGKSKREEEFGRNKTRGAEKAWGRYGIREVVGVMRRLEWSIVESGVFRDKGIGIL
jgi:hypothetical protein